MVGDNRQGRWGNEQAVTKFIGENFVCAEYHPNPVIPVTYYSPQPKGTGQAIDVGPKANPLYTSGNMKFPGSQLSFG